jgi:threonine synthase
VGLVSNLRCVECGRTYAPGEVAYTCPEHDDLEGILDVGYDYHHAAEAGFGPALLAARPVTDSLRRYLEILPVSDEQGEEFPQDWIGRTPVLEAPEVAKRLQISRLQIKDDGRLPTGSFKDRASAVGATRARLERHGSIACASTGNAASSLAGVSAHVGLTPYIFVPRTAPDAKVTQLAIFGAKVMLVDGSYDQAYDLCQQAVEEFGWYNRNCAVNPYLVEGKKTCGLELAEQIGEDPPDWISMSVGDGCSVAGVYKGLVEMKRFGFIERIPRLLAVQASGAAPLVKAFHQGSDPVPQEVHTIADSISVGRPRNARKALNAVRDSGGTFVEVEDDEIMEASYLLASLGGVFSEPAGVAALAGVSKARRDGIIWSTERVLHVSTGTGLKDIAAARDAAPEPPVIAADLDAVRDLVEDTRP